IKVLVNYIILCLKQRNVFFFFQAEDGIRDRNVTGVQTCALPISGIGENEELFSLEEVLEGINKKMRRRHPHVFDGVKAETPEEVDAIWQKIKEQERKGNL